MDSPVRINAPPLKRLPSPQADFLPVIAHPMPVKQEISPPSVPEEKATAHIRIPLHAGQGSARDQMIEIEWPVQSTTELLCLLQGLIK